MWSDHDFTAMLAGYARCTHPVLLRRRTTLGTGLKSTDPHVLWFWSALYELSAVQIQVILAAVWAADSRVDCASYTIDGNQEAEGRRMPEEIWVYASAYLPRPLKILSPPLSSRRSPLTTTDSCARTGREVYGGACDEDTMCSEAIQDTMEISLLPAESAVLVPRYSSYNVMVHQLQLLILKLK
jgi:hypothetical protein